jgi:hypothetical protein
MMEQYQGFWIFGTAVPSPPYAVYWTPGGAVLFQRSTGSVVELVRFTLHNFKFDDQAVAELFGLDMARLAVDTSYPELLAKQRDIE